MAVGLTAYATWSPETPFYLLVVGLGALGVAPLPGRPGQGPLGRACIGLVLATALVHAVFFGDDRYHIVVVPVLCLLAASAFRPCPRLAI
jgi:hypothetical protein